jgi:glycosyltransferase involved in cell wall biosynthesis
MERAGHQVSVFTFGNLDYEDRERDILRSPGIPLADSGYFFSLEYNQAARRKLAEMDLLHIHHPFASGQAGLRHGKRLNLPIVFTNHTRYDLYAETYFPRVPPALINRVLARYMTAFTADCDLVIAPSNGLRKVALGWGVCDDMLVIPNGVDLDRLRNPQPSISRAALDIPDGSTVLLYSGRLSPEKNLNLLFDAFECASKAEPDLFLLVVGGGPLEDSLQRRADVLGRVHMAGWVEYDDVPTYLALGDCFVTASVTEVHPMVVLEAMGAGMPVVGIRSPGISDSVRDGVDGLLTRLDRDELAAAILKIARKREMRDVMAHEARQRSQVFDIRLTACALLDQYARLVARQ